jgi:hypothetical protein
MSRRPAAYCPYGLNVSRGGAVSCAESCRPYLLSSGMTFRAQIYRHDGEVNRSLVDHPQDIYATTHKAAAEAVCGTGLVESGLLCNLAVRVWTKGVEPPDMAHFFRP